MNVLSIIFTMIFILLLSCNHSADSNNLQQWKDEIVAVEKDFNKMAAEQGLDKAFQFFAADEGVIRRKNKIIKGKEAIAEWYLNDMQPGDSLTWTPSFIDVSATGDLAYTYGDFVFYYLDSVGNTKSNAGIFHTVWKRQADGKWRFVWD